MGELGFRCLVPDLYKGTVAVEVLEAEHNMNNLDFPGAVKELSAAATYLKATAARRTTWSASLTPRALRRWRPPSKPPVTPPPSSISTPRLATPSSTPPPRPTRPSTPGRRPRDSLPT